MEKSITNIEQNSCEIKTNNTITTSNTNSTTDSTTNNTTTNTTTSTTADSNKDILIQEQQTEILLLKQSLQDINILVDQVKSVM